MVSAMKTSYSSSDGTWRAVWRVVAVGRLTCRSQPDSDHHPKLQSRSRPVAIVPHPGLSDRLSSSANSASTACRFQLPTPPILT